ncbi:hypothetical protein MRX96_034952 [Rhipicephalus microplus]
MCFNIKPLAVLFWLLSGYTTVSVKSKGSRQYNTEEFLKQQGYSYLVGLTGSESVANWCVRSHFQGTSEKGIEIYHQLKYVPQKVPEESDNAKADETQKDLPENQDSDNPQADEAQKEIYYEQHPKEHALILIVENDNKGIHVALRENDNTKSPKQDHFDVVYASYECLIIALKQTKGIYLKGKQHCFMWAKQTGVRRLPPLCESAFKEECTETNTFTSALDSMCSEHFKQG